VFSDMQITAAVEEYLIERGINNDRKYDHFHASEWDGCHRKVAYLYLEEKGRIERVPIQANMIDPRIQRVFGNGHHVHFRWRKYLQDIGILRGLWKCPICSFQTGKPFILGGSSKYGIIKPEQCDCGNRYLQYEELGFFDEETNWGGHVDGILDLRLADPRFVAEAVKPDTPDEDALMLCDFKSMKERKFKYLKRPEPKHYTQLQIYLYLSGLRCGKLIYESKDEQAIKEFIIYPDQEMMAVKKEEAIKLKYIVEHQNSRGEWVVPVRPFESPDEKGNWECVNCKFAKKCWSGTEFRSEG